MSSEDYVREVVQSLGVDEEHARELVEDWIRRGLINE